MTTNQTQRGGIHIGQQGFGVVNNYPPTHWEYGGVFRGAYKLIHVKPAAQTTAYPDQCVSWDVVQRIMQG